MRNVSVLGCGWLGLPLAEALVRSGFSVKGSVTLVEKSDQLITLGIEPFLLILERGHVELSSPRFFESEVLIVNIPPRRVPDIETVFPEQIGQLIFLLEKYGIGKVIFVSSTSVYPDTGGFVVSEDSNLPPEKASGRALLKAEKMLMQNGRFKTTVLRFGGLIGPGRDPSRFLTRKKEIINGNVPVNLIHQEDCIRIILGLIENEEWGDVFNACGPVHPLKKEFYGLASAVSGIKAPTFEDTEQVPGHKIVDSSKLINRLNYRFKYPSPLDWLLQ